MEHTSFDGLTRLAASGMRTRRRALHALGSVLLSGALGGVVTRLGLAEVTEAKSKQGKGKGRGKGKS